MRTFSRTLSFLSLTLPRRPDLISHSLSRCIWHTPLPAPPTPPPGPAPKQACDVPNCTVLTGAVVELLRLNAPWAPNSPRFETEASPVVNPAPLPADHGLLWPRPTQGHGVITLWSLDPTFDPAYSGMRTFSSSCNFGIPFCIIAHQTANTLSRHLPLLSPHSFAHPLSSST